MASQIPFFILALVFAYLIGSFLRLILQHVSSRR